MIGARPSRYRPWVRRRAFACVLLLSLSLGCGRVQYAAAGDAAEGIDADVLDTGPDARAFDVFAPDGGALDAFAPDAFADDTFADDTGLDAFAPDAFALDAFTGRDAASTCAAVETTGEVARFPDHDAIGTGDFRFEAWLRTVQPGVTVVLSNRSPAPHTGYLFGVYADDPFVQISDVPNIRTGTAITDGTWHHVAFVRDAGTIVAYVDGGPVAVDFPMAPRALPRAGEIFLGADTATGGSPYVGTLHTVRVWRVARSEAELRASWSGSVGDHPDLLFEAMLDQIVDGRVTANVRIGDVLAPRSAPTTATVVSICTE